MAEMESPQKQLRPWEEAKGCMADLTSLIYCSSIHLLTPTTTRTSESQHAEALQIWKTKNKETNSYKQASTKHCCYQRRSKPYLHLYPTEKGQPTAGGKKVSLLRRGKGKPPSWCMKPARLGRGRGQVPQRKVLSSSREKREFLSQLISVEIFYF